MYVPFDQLPDAARLWVYQADRQLTETEIAVAEKYLHTFCEKWVAHGHPLRTSALVTDKHFLLLAVDEEGGLPSGCSIDSSVSGLRELEKLLGVGLLDKARVPYRLTPETVALLPRTAVKMAVAEGHLTPTTPVFDVLVATVGDWRRHWVRPAAETWLSRYFATANNAC